MKEYHKIQTVFKRDLNTKFKTILDGQWTLPEFEYLANNNWVYTEKIDGTNIRVMCSKSNGPVNQGVLFGGKTDNAQLPAFLVSRLEQMFHTIEKRQKLAEMFPDGACLYGEGYGAKIQKCGGNYRLDQDFVLFDIKCGDWWLQRTDVEDVAEKLGLDIVPIIGSGTLYGAITLARAGLRSTWGDFEAEGIVARPAVELRTRAGHRIITKIKCRDFDNLD